MTRRDLEDEIQMPTDMAKDRHYTEQQTAEMWHVHRKTVHRMFDSVPGVFEFGEDGHRSRRIPESVVLARSSRPALEIMNNSHKFCTFLYA